MWLNDRKGPLYNATKRKFFKSVDLARAEVDSTMGVHASSSAFPRLHLGPKIRVLVLEFAR